LRTRFLVEKLIAEENLMRTFLASIALVLIGCGGDPLDPGAGDDPGGGTNTLMVEGSASAEPRVFNGHSSNDFDTDFSIRIELNGNDVATGTVTITSAVETVTLSRDGNGRWVGTSAGYDEVYQLDVISGADEVRGVIVDGPDIHVFTSPTAGATLDSTMPNAIQWDREDPADLVTFRADEIDRVSITDTGDYSMAPGSMKADKDQARTNTLEVRRTNHVAPAGAIAGSDFAVSIEQRLEVVAAPNPAL
jgi:hypothetical protein